jgi:hypothetical protein
MSGVSATSTATELTAALRDKEVVAQLDAQPEFFRRAQPPAGPLSLLSWERSSPGSPGNLGGHRWWWVPGTQVYQTSMPYHYAGLQ